jgi:transposase
LGRSRGGLSTKIHLVADAKGQPIRFALTGGQYHDAPQAIPLLTGIKAGHVIADKGYESDKVLAFIRSQGAVAVIPPKSNRKSPWEHDRELYKQRNLIERAFNKLKHWRRIATRYDRRSLFFLSALHLAAAIIWGG